MITRRSLPTTLLAVLGVLTIVWHVVGFCVGVRDGIKLSLAKRRAKIEAGDELRRKREAVDRGIG